MQMLGGRGDAGGDFGGGGGPTGPAGPGPGDAGVTDDDIPF